jgi:hypothetical protein
MLARRRGAHDEFSFQQFVSLPVVGQILQIGAGQSWLHSGHRGHGITSEL